MASKISTCPHCNNYVEGKRISSFKGKTARTAAKAGVKEASKDIVGGITVGGGALAGAAIGSAIPIIGTGIGATIGAAVGWVGKAMANDAIGKKVDQAADYLEDEYTEVVYQFSCPRCGHTWTSEEEYYEEDYDDEEEDEDEEEYISSNNQNRSKRSQILDVIKTCSRNSTWLDESCGIDNVYIDKCKSTLQRHYYIDVSNKEISSCKTIGKLIDLIESKMY